jgi:hypothetical protein
MNSKEADKVYGNHIMKPTHKDGEIEYYELPKDAYLYDDNNHRRFKIHFTKLAGHFLDLSVY